MKHSKPAALVVALVLLMLATPTTVQAGWFDSVMGMVLAGLLYVLFAFIYALMFIIKLNPQIYCSPDEVQKGCVVTAGVDKLIPYFLDILVPLYMVALMFTAGYFIVKSTNPRGRARAKMMLFKLLYSMLLVAFAPMIFQLMLDFQSLLTEGILSEGISSTDISRMSSNWTAGAFAATCLLIFIIYKLWWVAICVVVLRYILVVMFAVLFPLFLFLYFFDVTRGWGRKYIKRTITWVFTPVVQALFLVLAFRSIEGFGSVWDGLAGGMQFGVLQTLLALLSPLMGLLIVGACMLLFLFAPLIMTKLLAYVGGGLVAAGIATQSVPMTLLGGLMQGMGPSAMSYASGIGTRSGYYGQARGLIEGGIGGQPSLGLGGVSTGGSFMGATGEGKAPSGGRRGQNAADMADAETRAMVDESRGPVTGAPIGHTRRTPADMRSDEGHTEPGLDEGESSGGGGVGGGGAPIRSTTAAAAARQGMPPMGAGGPSAPGAAGGAAASAVAVGGGGAADMADIADRVSRGEPINEEELQKIQAFARDKVDADSKEAADKEVKALMKYLKDMKFSDWEAMRLKQLDQQRAGLYGQLAQIRLGNFLKRYIRDHPEK